MHCPRGKFPAFWSAGGGTAYVRVGIAVALRKTFGIGQSREAVLLRVQSQILAALAAVVEDGVRGEEVLDPAAVAVPVVALPSAVAGAVDRRRGGPHREGRGERVGAEEKVVDRAARLERALRQGVDVGVAEVAREEAELVGRDEDAVRVRADVGVVAEARAPAGAVWRPVGAVVLGGDVVVEPVAERAVGLAHGEVEVVRAQVGARDGVDLERQRDEEPAARVGIEVAGGVGDRGAEAGRARSRGPVDGGRVSVERVERHDARERGALSVVDPQDGVHHLEHEPVAGAETLVRRLLRELVPAVGEAVVAEVEAVEAPDELVAGRVLHARAGPRAGAGMHSGRQAAVGSPVCGRRSAAGPADRRDRAFGPAVRRGELGPLQPVDARGP